MTKKLLFSFFLLFGLSICVLHTASPVFAQRALEGEIEWNPKMLVVGDRIEITAKIYGWSRVPLMQDLKYNLYAITDKPGLECKTTDNTLNGDATIKGYCESKTNSGRVEIALEPEHKNTLTIDGEAYSPFVPLKIAPTFNDLTECGKLISPTSVTLVRQNTVVVKVAWVHVDNFLGSYDVLYGTKPGEFSNSRRTDLKNIEIDTPSPNATYYFKVRANSPCKWTAESAVFQYTPLTGQVSVFTAKASPKATVSAVLKKSPTVSPKASIFPSSSVSAQVQVSLSSETQLIEPDLKSEQIEARSLKIILIEFFSGIFNLFKR